MEIVTGSDAALLETSLFEEVGNKFGENNLSRESSQKKESMFWPAFPYAAATLVLAGSGLGAMYYFAGTSTVGLIVGIAAAIFGAYATYGVIGAAMMSSTRAEFRENVYQGMGAGVAAGLACTADFIVKVVLEKLIGKLIDKAFNNKADGNA